MALVETYAGRIVVLSLLSRTHPDGSSSKTVYHCKADASINLLELLRLWFEQGYLKESGIWVMGRPDGQQLNTTFFRVQGSSGHWQIDPYNASVDQTPQSIPRLTSWPPRP